MIYTHENHQLILDKGQGIVYSNNRLIFKGFSYTAIVTFVKLTNNHPSVVEIFRKQLEQRQKDDI